MKKPPTPEQCKQHALLLAMLEAELLVAVDKLLSPDPAVRRKAWKDFSMLASGLPLVAYGWQNAFLHDFRQNFLQVLGMANAKDFSGSNILAQAKPEEYDDGFGKGGC